MTDNIITMIDYGASNIRSAQKAFEYLGANVQLTDDPAVVRGASKLVLPGVGAFGSGIEALRAKELEEPIHEAVGRDIPLLGICVGMQFLFDTSDEMGMHRGLGLIGGRVTRFDFPKEERLKIPHMGWNELVHHQPTHWLVKDVPAEAHTYFVHSYYCIPQDSAVLVSESVYGRPFAAIVAHNNVFGLQFHPEKSQKAGLQILQNYMEYEA